MSLQEQLSAAADAFNSGDFQSAYDSFVMALAEIDSSDTTSQAAVRTNMGAALLNLGRAEEAIEQYEQALEQDPSNASSWHNKGVALKSLNKNSEAMTAFKQALEVDPTFSASIRGIVDAAMASDDLDTADIYLDQALATTPEDNPLRLDKANILLRRGDAEGAMILYGAILENPVDVPDVSALQKVHAVAMSQVAVEKDRAGDLDTAEELYCM